MYGVFSAVENPMRIEVESVTMTRRESRFFSERTLFEMTLMRSSLITEQSCDEDSLKIVGGGSKESIIGLEPVSIFFYISHPLQSPHI